MGLQDQVDQKILPLLGQSEGNISICPFAYSNKVGSWILAHHLSQHWYGYVYNNPDLLNDAIEYRAYLPPGTYDMKILSTKSPGSGIATLKINGDIVSIFDGYAVGMTWNQTWSETGIEMTKGGLKTLQFIAASKNALSTGWIIALTWISLWRTV